MEINDKRKELVALLKACPVHGDNPQDCPLHSMRNKEYEEQMSWLVQDISDNDLERIFVHHRTCYMRKLLERY